MTIKTRKEILKEWGVIKSNKDLKIFKKLDNMSFKEKELEYGHGFVKIVTELFKLKDTNQVRRVIKRTQSKEKRMLIGDTYLAMTSGYQIIKERCEFRLVDYCSEIQNECTFLTCPKHSVTIGSSL